MSILGLAFNRSIMGLICTTDKGYITYRLNPNLEKVLYNETKTEDQEDGGISIMKVFDKSNIAVLVGGGEKPFKSKDTIILHDQRTKQNILEINMREPIRNAFIIKEKIISVVEKKIFIFDWTGAYIDSKLTYSNEKGICAINTLNDKPMIVTLGTKKGEIAIWRIKEDDYKTIEAHKSNVEVIAISNNGKLVATASETGTVIRIFNTETNKMEYEFRRGSQSAKIYDLAFNKDATILGCYSSNGTLHLFELYNDITQTKNAQSMLSGFKGYLPEYFSSQWGFKQITIGNTNKALINFDDNNNLHIVLYDGVYYKILCNDNSYEDITQGNLHINNK